MKFDTPGRVALPAIYCARHRKLCKMQGSAYDSMLKLEVMWAVAVVQCPECRLSVAYDATARWAFIMPHDVQLNARDPWRMAA